MSTPSKLEEAIKRRDEAKRAAEAAETAAAAASGEFERASNILVAAELALQSISDVLGSDDPNRCFANHMGLWLCDPSYLREAVTHIKAGTWRAFALEQESDSPGNPINVGDGMRLIQISGPMMKGRSKFGGTSTVDTRRQLREAAADESVRSILLHIDSPGGHVAGTADLADDVAAVNRIKPVHVHADDMMASAALWVGSQARRITANRTAEIGSMGVMGVLVDESGKMEAAGVKVHLITTGERKADGAGLEVTDAAIAAAQERVDSVFAQFRGDVARGRGRKLSKASLSALSDARVVDAATAAKMGLIDAVGTVDAAVDAMPSRRGQRAKLAEFRATRNRA